MGTLFLGYTALAVNDAVQRAGHRSDATSAAAIATAAHDVLAHYLPNTQAKLDGALAATLGAIRDSRAERKGIRIGQRSAAAMIASRVGDGFGDPQYVYALDATQPGISKPVGPRRRVGCSHRGLVTSTRLSCPATSGSTAHRP